MDRNQRTPIMRNLLRKARKNRSIRRQLAVYVRQQRMIAEFLSKWEGNATR
jgi:hypothetical protein